MSFDTRTISRFLSKPIFYFKFVRGTNEWRYTTADRERTLFGQTYLPAPISRSKIRSGPERRQQPITVKAPKDLPVLSNWRPFPPQDAISLTIFLEEVGEAEIAVDWIGRVLTIKSVGENVSMTCQNTQVRAHQAKLYRAFQRGCWSPWGSQGLGMCNIVKSGHALPTTMTQVNTVTFTSSSFLLVPSGRLAGGWVEWTRVSDGVVEYRTINEHVGNQIVLAYGLNDIAVDFGVVAYPGCKHTPDDCNDYYDNMPNYGGQYFMPNKNPHDGNPVW